MKYLIFIFASLLTLNVQAEQMISEGDFSQINKSDEFNQAQIVVLNKITAKSDLITFSVNTPLTFSNLSITVNTCVRWQRPEISEYVAHLTVIDQNKADQILFNGWLFSNNLSANSFQHPVFELLLKGCPANLKDKVNDE